LPDQRRSLDVIAWLIGDLMELGDVTAADRELEGLVRATESVRLPFYGWVVEAIRASRALLAGRFGGGLPLAPAARPARPDSEPASVAEQIYALQMAIANQERDRITESEAQLTLLADLVPGVPAWRCSLALLHAETGREAEARAALVQLAARDFTDLPR